MKDIQTRFPRLIAAMRYAGFSAGESVSAINARRIGDDYAAAEAICFVGGAAAAIRHAIHCRQIRRNHKIAA